MRICIIGHYANGKNIIDGQTIKTRNLFNGLRLLNNFSLSYVDTYQWKKHPFKLFYKLFKAIKNNDALIMMPAHNGVKVFSSLLLFLKKKNTKLFYSVIGGWLPELVMRHKHLCSKLRKFDGIWVETDDLQKSMISLGFTNISVVNNFKDLIPLKPKDLVYQTSQPFSFCIFSRICEEKGITDAILTLQKINVQRIKATLDIYGPIQENYRHDFMKLINDHRQYVSYKGIIKSENSVNVIKNYFMLLFPTRFYTEGIPGTIIDSYFAGVPVLYSEWKSCFDVLSENTGVKFEFKSNVSFEKNLLYCINHYEYINSLKLNCLKAAKMYEKTVVINKISNLLREK